MKQFKENRDVNSEFCELLKKVTNQHEEYNFNYDESKEFVNRQLKKRKKEKYRKYLKSVAMIAIILVTAVSISIWYEVDGVYGGKRFVDKCVNIISPIDYEEEVNEIGEITTTITVSEEQHLDAAAKRFEGLKIAKYIPDGYVFDTLTIRQGAIFTSVEYIYMRGEEPLIIGFEYYKNSPEITVTGETYYSSNTGKTFYVDVFPEENQFSVIEINNQYDCMVMGTGDKDIGIRVIESIDDFQDQ